jgi:hypothetical protein
MENDGDGTAASRALRAQRAWPFLIIVDRHAAAPPLLRAGRWRSQFSRRSLLWGLPGSAQRPIADLGSYTLYLSLTVVEPQEKGLIFLALLWHPPTL